MNNSYNEEMDILTNDFNTELKTILGDKKLEELGVIDLRRLKGQFEALNELNQDLRDRVRETSGVSLTNVAPRKDFSYLDKDRENLAFDLHDYETIKANYHFLNDEMYELNRIERNAKAIIDKYNDDIPALAQLAREFPRIKDFMTREQLDLVEANDRGQEFVELRDKSVELENDNRVSLQEIESLIAIKNTMRLERQEERRRIKQEKKENLELLERYRKTYDDIKNNDALTNKEDILAEYEKLINNVEEKNRQYDERLEQIHNDFDAILHGGALSQIEEIKEESTGLKEEEVEKAREEIEKIYTEEEMLEELNRDRIEKPEELDLSVEEKRNKEERIMLLNSMVEKEKKDIENTKEFLKGQRNYLETLKNAPFNTEEERKKIEEAIAKTESTLREMEERLAEKQKELEELGYVEDKTEEIEDINEIEEIETLDEEEKKEEIETLEEPTLDEIEVLEEQKEDNIEVLDSHEEKKEPETIDLGLESFTAPAYAVGTLGALRRSGKLPQNLTSKKLIEICKSLGMNAADLNYKPSITELQRLSNDKDVKLAFTNLNIMSKHEKELERFDKVLKDYEKLDTEGLDDNFAHRVEVESGKVRSDILEYEAKAKEMLSGNVLEHASSQHIKNRLESLDARSDKFNEKLKEQYRKLDEEMKMEKNTKIKQMFSDYRIRKMEKKIDSLSKKQNKVSGKQFEIMNQQTDKYIQKKTKDLMKYQEKQKKTENKIAQVNQLMREKESLENEIKKYEADLEHSTGTKLVDRVERSQLNRAKGKLEREVERLGNKINRSNRQAQVSMSIAEMMGLTEDGAKLSR